VSAATGSLSIALKKARATPPIPPVGGDFWLAGFWVSGFWVDGFWVKAP